MVNLIILPENDDCMVSPEDVVAAGHLGSTEAQAMGKGVIVLVGDPQDAIVCHLVDVGLQR